MDLRFNNTKLGWKRICDYCSQPNPEHTTKLTRTPNGETIYSELCTECFNDIISTHYEKKLVEAKEEQIMQDFLSLSDLDVLGGVDEKEQIYWRDTRLAELKAQSQGIDNG